MSLDTSNKILKVTGILSIIGGVFMFILGILAVAGGGAIGMVAEAEDEAVAGGIAVFAGLMILFAAAVTLSEGIFSVMPIQHGPEQGFCGRLTSFSVPARDSKRILKYLISQEGF